MAMWLTLAVLVFAFVSMAREWLSADATLMAALAVLVAAQVLPLDEALNGFANPTLVALGSLYIIAAALRETGALATAGQVILGSMRNLRLVLARQSISVSMASAVLNNTPIVAMGIPAVQAWAKEHRVPATRLLMPLSFASILGGTWTLMGTSTNLVSDGLLRTHGMEGLGFFELAAVGIPCTIAGWLYLVFIAPRLLAKIEPELGEPGAMEAERQAIRAAKEEGHWAGVDAAEGTHETHTAVVREGSRLVGMRVRDAGFQEHFNARVLEVRRSGHSVQGSVQELELKRGDTLVLLTGPGFKTAFEDTTDFFITSGIGGDQAEEIREREERAAGHSRWEMLVAAGTLLGVIVVAATGWLHLAPAALLGATLLMVTGVIDPGQAREAVDWEVLVVIGAALGLGRAMEVSGAAAVIGQGFVAVGQEFGSIGLLAALILGTAVLTELITNNGAVALIFPIAASVAVTQGVDPRPLIVGVTIAASMAMSTPLGYQTNLMVYSAGDYRFSDFARVGFPLQVLVLIVAIAVIPQVWPL